MKKIIFPTDFSETANNAFLYTLHLAKTYDAEVYVLHTFTNPILSSLHAGKPENVSDVYTDLELGAFETFKEEGQKLRDIAKNNQLEDIKMTFLFEVGNLVYILKKLVEQENFDLVVMGTNGASGWSKKFWGTNTLNTMNELDIPVLSIPHSATFQSLKNIGFTTIFKDSDKDILKEILKAANYFGGKIKVLHIIEYGGNIEKKEIYAAEKIADWSGDFPSETIDFVVLKSDTVKKGISSFVEKENIDALVIAKRNLSFIDSLFYTSLSENLAGKMEIPLLVVKEK